MATPPATTPSPRPAPSAAGPAPGGGLLNPTIDPIRLFKQYYLWLIAAAVAGVVLGVGLHLLLSWQFPRYTARVTLRALPFSEKPTDIGNRTTSREGGADDMQKFISTQQQILASERLLNEAANEPQIRNETKWAKQFLNQRTGEYDAAGAGKTLADHVISTRSPAESILILVSATTRDATDAATIANTVVRTYINQLGARSSRENAEQLQILSRRLANVEGERQALERRAQRLLGDNRIESVEFQQTASSREIAKISETMTELKNDLKQRKEQLAQYEAQQGAVGGAVYPDILRAEVQKDIAIFSLDQSLSSLRAQLGSARARLGPRHPDIARLDALVRATETQRANEEQRLLSEKFNALLESFRVEVSGLEARIKESDDNLTRSMQRSGELTILLEDYKRIKEDLESRAKLRDELKAKIDELQDMMQSPRFNRVAIETNASIPEFRSFPKPEIVIPITAVLCAGLMAGLLLLRELLEQRVRTPADVAVIPRVRVLGVIPDLAEDPAAPASLDAALRECPDGVIAEAVRQLRTAVLKRMRAEGKTTLVIAGGLPGAGCTSVLANLARSCAAQDDRVLVIDGNLRRPRCHSVFGVAEGPGLGEALAGTATLESVTQKTDMPTLHVITAGMRSARVYERLNSDAMTRLLDTARASYDIVLIDTPPLTVAGDAAVLANRCDASALVARAFSETRGLIARVSRQLSECRGEFLGVVVNGVKSSAGGYFKRNYQMSHEYHGGGDVGGPGGKPPKAPRKGKPQPAATSPGEAA